MKAKELLEALMQNYISIEASGIVKICKETGFDSFSWFFPVADDAGADDGEYFYIYLDDEEELKSTEKFLTRFGLNTYFDYAIPLRDSECWVGLVKIED